MRETSLDYAHPERRLPVRIANRLLGARSRARLDARELVRSAEKKRRRSFMDRSFQGALERLVDSIETEAQLHPLGHAIARSRILGVLDVRLRVEALRERHPERFTTATPRPIVVLGLQRTGTTFLHRLLAASGFRALRSFEAVDPLPGRERRRRVQSALSVEALRYMAPDFFLVHPIEATGPEEDVLLLELSFLSAVPEALMYVPSYAGWAEETDATPAYRYARQILAMMSSGATRWVLKTPHHLENIDALHTVYPDATYVWTHRDPVVTVASFCSMVAHAHGFSSDHVDPRRIGRDWLGRVARMVEHGMAEREKLGDARFVDVAYHDLVSGPRGTVERILEKADAQLGTHDRTLEQALSAQRKDRFGKHRYHLASFGLDEEMVRDAFADYRERFADFIERRE